MTLEFRIVFSLVKSGVDVRAGRVRNVTGEPCARKRIRTGRSQGRSVSVQQYVS